MLYATNPNDQTLAAGGVVTFSNVLVRTGCTAVVNAGSGSVNLNKPGFYRVTFSVSANAAAANVVINMLQNGAAVSGATASGYSASAGEDVNLVIDAIVQVPPAACNCNQAAQGVTLTFVSQAAATVTNAAITVSKLA